jgi:hypothetical protein
MGVTIELGVPMTWLAWSTVLSGDTRRRTRGSASDGELHGAPSFNLTEQDD